MKIFIEKARVSDPHSPHHGDNVSLFFKDGVLEQINDSKPEDTDVSIDEKELWISPGWVDVGAQSGEPGYEHRETLNTLSRSARNGGFTTVLIFPNTDPVLDSKAEIEYILRKADQLNMNMLPIAAATMGCEGEQMTEMMDLHRAGAVAFSDGSNSIQRAAPLLKALEYIKSFDGLIIQRPYIESLAFDGNIHEGKQSLKLGLAGIPSMSEMVAVRRALEILEYSESKLLLHGISSREAVNAISSADAGPGKLQTSVAAANLYFTDEALTDYDPVFKVLPPLRSEEDRRALIEGIKEGVIDLIVSNHEAVEEEGKELEFQHAPFGMIGLSTFFGAVRTATVDRIPIDDLIPLFSQRPRDIFDLKTVSVREGAEADFTLFQPDKQWTVTEKHLGSKSRNSPFIGEKLTGKPYATLWKKSYFKI